MRTSQWRNFQWRFGTVALLVALLVGCVAPASAPSGTAGESQAASAASGEAVVLRTSSVSEPTTLDPNLAEDYYSITPIEQMFLGLTNINNTTNEVEPELAESWTTSADGLVWTFKMRSDAKWSDGKPVTAKDVEYSVKRAIKPETASPYAYVLYIIKNAVAINQTALDLQGPDAELVDSFTEAYLFALGGPIYAGTNEIQRNIIAERLLGLPRESK